MTPEGADCHRGARIVTGGRVLPPGGTDCHRGARIATGGPNKLAEYKAAAVEATVASSHCGRNRTLAVDLAVSGPLAGLKRSLGGLKCCEAGLRPL